MYLQITDLVKLDSLCYQDCSHFLQSSILVKIKTFSDVLAIVNSVCTVSRFFLPLTLLFLQPAGWERAGSLAGRWPEQPTQTMQRAISCYLMQCSAIEMGWARSVCLWECLPIQLLLGDWLHTGLPVRCDWLLLQQAGLFPLFTY